MSNIKAIQLGLSQLNKVILGKENEIKLALTCLLAKGHLLIEDLPGMGKTTLAHALAGTLGLSYQRIQFTSDLLPGDLLGLNIFNREDGKFHFHPGPIFSNLVLADEINRASPKTQSALLEAMEERQVTQEGETRALPEPFFVIATQNPSDQSGTHALPESQLDRFMMRISLGYPSEDAEKQLLKGIDRRALANQLQAVLNENTLSKIQALVSKVQCSDSIVNYV
ncbi:AAA family ATPase, partial [Oleiphilus sp. HI0085]